MSVEHHNVSGNPREVNIFYASLRTSPVNHLDPTSHPISPRGF
jgi:hypothetical protein